MAARASIGMRRKSRHRGNHQDAEIDAYADECKRHIHFYARALPVSRGTRESASLTPRKRCRRRRRSTRHYFKAISLRSASFRHRDARGDNERRENSTLWLRNDADDARRKYLPETHLP